MLYPTPCEASGTIDPPDPPTVKIPAGGFDTAGVSEGDGIGGSNLDLDTPNAANASVGTVYPTTRAAEATSATIAYKAERTSTRIATPSGQLQASPIAAPGPQHEELSHQVTEDYFLKTTARKSKKNLFSPNTINWRCV